jgi:hypothetical protein
MERAETVGWNTFWAEHGQSWRTEPEIAVERQAELEACCAITPDVRTAGAVPFMSHHRPPFRNRLGKVVVDGYGKDTADRLFTPSPK